MIEQQQRHNEPAQKCDIIYSSHFSAFAKTVQKEIYFPLEQPPFTLSKRGSS
jgi:hypothetical protein